MKQKLRLIILLLVILFVTPASAFAATLSLSPSTGTFNKGCTFTVDIKLDTNGVQTDGTDAILLYDATRFTATSITSGTIYSDYPGNNIDSAKGVVTTSGLASISSPFSGQGTLATVTFTVKDNAQTGAAQISFDFDPTDKTKTIDSNVVQRGGSISDVLSSVTNGSYTIGTGTTCATSTLPKTGQGSIGTASGSAQPATPAPITQLPQGGTQELTYTVAIVGSILTILGILGLALL